MACLMLKQYASSIIPHNLMEAIVIKILKAILEQIEPFGLFSLIPIGF